MVVYVAVALVTTVLGAGVWGVRRTGPRYVQTLADNTEVWHGPGWREFSVSRSEDMKVVRRVGRRTSNRKQLGALLQGRGFHGVERRFRPGESTAEAEINAIYGHLVHRVLLALLEGLVIAVPCVSAWLGLAAALRGLL